MTDSKGYYGTAPVTFEMEVAEVDEEDVVGYVSDSTDTTYDWFGSPDDEEETVEVEFNVGNAVTAGGLVSKDNDEEDEPSFIEEGTLMVGY